MERRHAAKLIFAAGAATTIGLAPKPGFAQDSPQPEIIIDHELSPVQTSPVQILKPVDVLKKAIDRNGNKPLGIDEAQEIVNWTNEWARTRANLRVDTPEQSIILTAGPGTLTKPRFNPNQPILDSPLLQIFYQRNPNYDRSEQSVKRVWALYSSTSAGVTDESGSAINLDFVNNLNGYTDRPPVALYQYSGFGPNPAREPLTPTVALISIEDHEKFHRKNNKIVDMDPDVLEAILRDFPARDPNVIYIGTQRHFIGSVEAKRAENVPGVSGIINWLNEHATDIEHAAASVLDGLPRMVGYGTPLDQDNFRLMLIQMKMPYDEFHDLKSNHLYKEFVVRFAQNAQASEYDYTKLFDANTRSEELLSFGIKFLPSQRPPNWRLIKSHYPQVLLSA